MPQVEVLSPIKYKRKVCGVGAKLDLPQEIIDALPEGRVQTVRGRPRKGEEADATAAGDGKG